MSQPLNFAHRLHRLRSIVSSTTTAFWIPWLSAPLLILAAPALAQAPSSTCISETTGQRQPCLQFLETPQTSDTGTVELRLKATQADGRPIMDLTKENFTLTLEGETLSKGSYEFRLSDDRPAPSRIVMLVDYSGSMEEVDGQGVTKFVGAMEGIKSFVQELQGSEADLKIAIVPFAEATPKSCPGFTVVTENQLLQPSLAADQAQKLLGQFRSIKEPDLITDLDERIQNKNNWPCPNTATNLYDALAKTLEFLGNPDNPDFYPPAVAREPNLISRLSPPDSSTVPPRLYVILLSDGFNTVPFASGIKDNCDPAHLKKFTQDYLQNSAYAGITVYALGYGLSPDELQTKYGASDCKNVRWTEGENKPIPSRDFLDAAALETIAKATGGFSDLSGDSEGIARIFREIRNAIQGGYIFEYSQADLCRNKGKAYTVTVTATSPNNSDLKLKASEGYSIGLFGDSCDPKLLTRVGIQMGTLIFFGFFAATPFYFWTKSLDKS